MKKLTAKAGRFTPVKAITPVIAGRVPASLHRLIKESAKKSGRSMSDELAWRAGLSYEWEKTFGEIRQLIASNRRGMAAELLQHMISEGWTAVHTSKGVVWAPPGSPVSELVEILKKSFDKGRP